METLVLETNRLEYLVKEVQDHILHFYNILWLAENLWGKRYNWCNSTLPDFNKTIRYLWYEPFLFNNVLRMESHSYMTLPRPLCVMKTLPPIPPLGTLPNLINPIRVYSGVFVDLEPNPEHSHIEGSQFDNVIDYTYNPTYIYELYCNCGKPKDIDYEYCYDCAMIHDLCPRCREDILDPAGCCSLCGYF